MTYEEHVSFYEAVETHLRNTVKIDLSADLVKNMKIAIRALLGPNAYDKSLINDEQIYLTWNINDDRLACLNLYTYTLCHGIIIPYYNWVYEKECVHNSILLYSTKLWEYDRAKVITANENF